MFGDRQPRRPRQRLDLFLCRHRLAGQGRFVGAEIARLQEADVGRHAIAGVELHDVARHNRLGRYQLQPAVAHDQRTCGLEEQQGLHGAPGAPLSGKSQRRVDDQHDADGDGFEVIADDQGEEDGRDQQADDDAAQLVAENDERRHAGGAGCGWGRPSPAGRPPPPRTVRVVWSELDQHALDLQRVPRRARLRDAPGWRSRRIAACAIPVGYVAAPGPRGPGRSPA